MFIKTPCTLFSPGKCTCSMKAAHCSGQTTSADIPWCNLSTWTPILCMCHQQEWEWGSWTLTSQPSKPTTLMFKNLKPANAGVMIRFAKNRHSDDSQVVKKTFFQMCFLIMHELPSGWYWLWCDSLKVEYTCNISADKVCNQNHIPWLILWKALNMECMKTNFVSCLEFLR